MQAAVTIASIALVAWCPACHSRDGSDSHGAEANETADSDSAGNDLIPHVPSGAGNCADPPQPGSYTNGVFATTDCGLASFEGDELARANAYVTDPMFHMSYAVSELDQVYPNRSLWVKWYEERGASPYPGQAILTGESIEEAPVYVYAIDCPDKTGDTCTRYLSSSGRVFYSRGGMCDYFPKTDRLVGFIEQVVLQEVTVDEDAGTSSWVPGGKTWCIERLDFDVEQNNL